MTSHKSFAYVPGENETEKASNSYLMSLIALMAGLPIPIINLLATLIFFLGNRKGTYFVRWHCTQALMSQLTVFFMNTAAFWWTISVIFYDTQLTNLYISYIITVATFNFFEFVVTIYAAVQTRKGKHVEWWFWGPLTDLLCKP